MKSGGDTKIAGKFLSKAIVAHKGSTLFISAYNNVVLLGGVQDWIKGFAVDEKRETHFLQTIRDSSNPLLTWSVRFN